MLRYAKRLRNIGNAFDSVRPAPPGCPSLLKPLVARLESPERNGKVLLAPGVADL